MLVGEPVGAGLFPARGNSSEQRAVGDTGELEPGLKGCDRAGEVAGAAADLDLAPAGLAAHPDDDALIEDFDPSGAFLGLIGAAVEADDFGAAQTAGETNQQDGAVAQPPQIAIEGLDHAKQVFGEDGFLLVRRSAMLAADAFHHLGDVTVGAVERLTALCASPG